MALLLKKHWTSLLGVLFILASLIYFFKFTIDQGWVTDPVKIGIGLLIGAGFVLVGIKMGTTESRQLFGEILTGLGVSLLYMTFSFAGIYYSLWDPMIVLLCMLAVTIGATLYSYTFNMRILMNIALIGALASPMIMRPENDQVFTLFLYLFVINAAYFYLSIHKSWTELRLIAFSGTWLMYIAYYVHFNPLADTFWSMPYRYAVAAFIFYVIALTVSSWKNNLRFDGLNLYLSFVNAVLFGIWSVVILDGIINYSYPLAMMGLLYIALGAIVYKLTPHSIMPVLIKIFGGLFLILISASQFGKHLDSKILIDVHVWIVIAALLLIAGQYKNLDVLKVSSVIIWFFVGCYWYVYTWDAPRGDWFGVYIPFLNWGALSWMLLAGLGFYFSEKLSFAKVKAESANMLSKTFSILSHLVVGGLLTRQAENMFFVYDWPKSMMPLTLSISWGVYAVLLFLWGAHSNQKVFRIFGSIVLIFVALKTLVFDLAGEETIYKVIVLFILGCISFLITFINNKWQSKEIVEQPKVDEAI